MPRRLEHRVCKQCAEPFMGTCDKNYCTLDCQYQWKREHYSGLPCPMPGCDRQRPTKNSHRCRECKAQRTLVRTLTAVARARRSAALEREQVCIDCGRTFITRQARAVMCSEDCSKRHHRHAAKARRRQRMAGGARVSRAAIIARDNGTCQLCRKRVRFDVDRQHTLAPSMDHIVPLSCGGRHEPTNVQLAHVGCNRLRGAGGSVQLRLVG